MAFRHDTPSLGGRVAVPREQWISIRFHRDRELNLNLTLNNSLHVVLGVAIHNHILPCPDGVRLRNHEDIEAMKVEWRPSFSI